ncbi:hypothetical protein DSECCO2_558610 [anaerobic digester metagenome]
MRGRHRQGPSLFGGESYKPARRVPLPHPDRPALLDAPAGGEGHDLEVGVGVLPVVHLLDLVDGEPVVHDLLDVPLRAVPHQHLRVACDALGDPGVTDQQDVYISPDLRAVLQLLGRSAEELQRDALLDLVVAVDGGGDGANDLPEHLGVLGLLPYLLLVLVRDHHFLVLVLLELHGDDRQVDVEERGLYAVALLLAAQYAVQHHPVPWGYDTGQVVLQEGCETLGLRSAAQSFRGLLHLHLLSVDVDGLLGEQLELGASGGASAALLLLVALHGLPEVQPLLRLQYPGGAAHAPEHAEH